MYSNHLSNLTIFTLCINNKIHNITRIIRTVVCSPKINYSIVMITVDQLFVKTTIAVRKNMVY